MCCRCGAHCAVRQSVSPSVTDAVWPTHLPTHRCWAGVDNSRLRRPSIGGQPLVWCVRACVRAYLAHREQVAHGEHCEPCHSGAPAHCHGCVCVCPYMHTHARTHTDTHTHTHTHTDTQTHRHTHTHTYNIDNNIHIYACTPHILCQWRAAATVRPAVFCCSTDTVLFAPPQQQQLPSAVH